MTQAGVGRRRVGQALSALSLRNVPSAVSSPLGLGHMLSVLPESRRAGPRQGLRVQPHTVTRRPHCVCHTGTARAGTVIVLMPGAHICWVHV